MRVLARAEALALETSSQQSDNDSCGQCEADPDLTLNLLREKEESEIWCADSAKSNDVVSRSEDAISSASN